MALYDFEWLSIVPRERVLQRLATILSELSNISTEIAYTQNEELRAKVDAFATSHESSITGKEKVATYAAATFTYSLNDLHAKRYALLNEKEFIMTRLQYGE